MLKKLIIGLFATLLLSSCGKFTRDAKINRDCTGTYLELNNRDYLICNPTMVSSYADGSTVKVTYKSVSNCPADPDLILCELYHKSYGFVEITEVK